MTTKFEVKELKTFGDIAKFFDISLEDLTGSNEGDLENCNIWRCQFTDSLSNKEVGDEAYIKQENNKWYGVEKIAYSL